MTELTPNEKDLLKRIHKKPELRPLFFKKVKGLKWFDALLRAGYFNPKEIPPPISKKEGYITIPSWPAINYLVRTVSELTDDDRKYAAKFLEIICESTKYAKECEFSNHHVWWQFSKILSLIPIDHLTTEHLEIVDYWLDDRYERELVATQVGEKWLPRLLEDRGIRASELALGLLKILYKIVFTEQDLGENKTPLAKLRFKDHSFKITKTISPLAGDILGLNCLTLFDRNLKNILDKRRSDKWSCVWQPAIEDHDQNRNRGDAENILILAYRDSLQAYLEKHPRESVKYLTRMFNREYQTVSRIAINAIGENPIICRDLFDTVIKPNFFSSNYCHEVWHFLNQNYSRLSDDQQLNVLDIISTLEIKDDDNGILEGATAYRQASWLSAIKDCGASEKELYQAAIHVTKTEPDHPDFSSYMSTGWVEEESSFSIDDLRVLPIGKLVETLACYEEDGGPHQSGIEGLTKTIKQLIKANPLQYYRSLEDFSELDLAYIYPVIEAFSELWKEKAKLPWDEVWKFLLEFCFLVVQEDRFWNSENGESQNQFVANRFWIVGSIGHLVELGVKSDEHAFSEKFHDDAEKLITLLLDKEKGDKFEKNSNDAVSISISSPRGQCLGALINLTLRMCRLSDKNNNGTSVIWQHFQPYYEKELDRGDIPEYEFATLVGLYLPSFLYMSKSWILSNLNRIFAQEPYMKWSCAMQGYSYVSSVDHEIYIYLRDHGDFIKILDDENLSKNVENKVIEQIGVAFIHDFEKITDENSLISLLVKRADYHELSHLVWFLWTRRKEDELELRDKIYVLWPMLLKGIDFSTQEGRLLASNLCYWAAFVDFLDDQRKDLLLAIAAHADESHNAYDLLQSLSKISREQPFEANEILIKMFDGSSPDYPEESIREILTNLVRQGDEGIRAARTTISEYIKVGNENPQLWLHEIIKKQQA